DGNTVSGDGCSATCQLEDVGTACQISIAKAGKTFDKKLKAIQKCRDNINAGKLALNPAACLTEPSSRHTLVKEAYKGRKVLEQRCAVQNDTSRATTIDPLHALNACGASVNGMSDLVYGCQETSHEGAIVGSVASSYGRTLSPAEADERNCQKAIAKAGRNY